MRTFLLVTALIFTPTVLLAEPQSIIVEVSDIDVDRGGNLIVLVFGAAGFPVEHDKALFAQTQPVSAARMTFTLDVPAPSQAELAFKALHDQDANGKVTKNWTGIWPREGLGFSNGARMHSLGPPKFDDAKIPRAQALQGVAMPVRYP